MVNHSRKRQTFVAREDGLSLAKPATERIRPTNPADYYRHKAASASRDAAAFDARDRGPQGPLTRKEPTHDAH